MRGKWWRGWGRGRVCDRVRMEEEKGCEGNGGVGLEYRKGCEGKMEWGWMVQSQRWKGAYY